MNKPQFTVIIPNNVFPIPSKRELSAARIIANYLKSDVVCQPCSNRKTPDFYAAGLYWELKTPTGTGKYNIQHLLHLAIQQSPNIIIDARFSKMHITRITHELKLHSKITTKGVKRLLLITKDQKVVEII